METANADTEHQRKCPEILIKPEKLPSLFFMKETIPGGVLQDCESLVSRRDNGDIPPNILTTHQVRVRSSSEVSELPPLAVQRRDTEDLGWLQEISEYNSIDQDDTTERNSIEQNGTTGYNPIEQNGTTSYNSIEQNGTTRYNSIEQNGTAAATTRNEMGEAGKVINHYAIPKGEDHKESSKNFINPLKPHGKGEDAKTFVNIEDQTKSNAQVSESADNENTEGIFQFCSKHVFLMVYIVLGLVIMVLTVLNLVFGFKPFLLISLIVVVFLLLVLLTD